MEKSNFFRIHFLLGGWLLLGGLHVLRTPLGAFTHDFKDHLLYTRILTEQNRLPLPREGWETYQPPLYYMVNRVVLPAGTHHALIGRFLSVFYGFLFLWIIQALLRRYDMPLSHQALTLSFIASTPAFVFLFTSYNNDALATVCSALAIFWSIRLLDRWNSRWALYLFFSITAGLYSKLSFLFTLGSLFFNALIFSVQAVRTKLILLVVLSPLILLPWLIGHNYRLTQRLLPVPADFPLYEAIKLPHSWWQTVLTPPGWTPGEWKDPWAHQWDALHHKKNSYLAYLLSTSVFGEFSFTFLPPIIFWAIGGAHVGMLFLSLGVIRRTRHCQIAAVLILFGVLLFPLLIRRAAYAGLMDFRYIAWLWLPAAVLWSETLVHDKKHAWVSSSSRALMASGIILQMVFLIVLWIASFRWYL